MQHYEPIRLSLLKDSAEGIQKHGKAIAAELRALEAEFSASHAGVSHEVAMVVKEKLPSMIAAAEEMARADTLENARTHFYELSISLVRWQEGRAKSDRPSVAFCSMHKKSWLQPGEKIGNPYGGMPRCGTIVSK